MAIQGSGIGTPVSPASSNNNLNYTQFISQVKVLLGRTNDSSRLSDAVVGRLVNDAQRTIVRIHPGLKDVNVVDKTTFSFVTDQYEYDLTDLSSMPLQHIMSIKYIDTTNSTYYKIYPYHGGLSQLDRDYPYLPDYGTGYPQYYVRRGDKLEVFPVPSSDANGVPMWLEYSYLPPVMSGTDYPVLKDFTEPILHLATASAYRYLKKPAEAREYEQFAASQLEIRLAGEAEHDKALFLVDHGDYKD